MRDCKLMLQNKAAALTVNLSVHSTSLAGDRTGAEYDGKPDVEIGDG